MKVIFIEDVPGVARVGQTKVVADGYARNYLLPQSLAVIADSQSARAVESKLKKRIQQRELEEAEMSKLAEKLEGTEITIAAKVGENEKLYGSVTGADIAEELSKQSGHEIDKKKVELHEPIRQVGSREVVLRLGHDITAAITVHVVSDAPPEEKPEKKSRAGKEPETAARVDEPLVANHADVVEEEEEVEVEEEPALGE